MDDCRAPAREDAVSASSVSRGGSRSRSRAPPVDEPLGRVRRIRRLPSCDAPQLGRRRRFPVASRSVAANRESTRSARSRIANLSGLRDAAELQRGGRDSVRAPPPLLPRNTAATLSRILLCAGAVDSDSPIPVDPDHRVRLERRQGQPTLPRDRPFGERRAPTPVVFREPRPRLSRTNGRGRLEHPERRRPVHGAKPHDSTRLPPSGRSRVSKPPP